MKEFNILLVGDFLSEKEIITALNSFADLFHSVTFKHQRKMKLTIVESPQNFPTINKMIADRNIKAACSLLSPDNEAAVLEVLISSTIMFLPTTSNIAKLIPIAFKHELPILTISTEANRDLLDNTCSRIVKNSENSEVEERFSISMRMLYFDPEARQILAKGSLARFNKEYSWGNVNAISA